MASVRTDKFMLLATERGKVQYLFREYALDPDPGADRHAEAVRLGRRSSTAALPRQIAEHVVSKDDCWEWSGAGASSPNRP